MANVRRRKENLHRQSPNCTHCGVPTVLLGYEPHTKQPDNLATLYHDTKTVNGVEMPMTILACRKCMTDKNDVKQKSVGIEELRMRSSPQGMCTCSCGNRHIKSVKLAPPESPEVT